MKRPLLLLASLVMGLAASAQNWSAPTIGQDAYVGEFKTSVLADSLQGDSTFYYLYNIGAKAFLTEGKAPSHSQWSTNAILSETEGHLMMVSKYELVEEADGKNVGTSEPAEWDGKTYVLHNKRTAWQMLTLSQEIQLGVFVDRANQIDYKWEIISQGNGTYRIKTADVNPTYSNEALGIAESWFGWNALDDDYLNYEIKSITPVIDMSDPDVEPYIDWAFISEAAYNLYAARYALYNTLNSAVEAGVDYAAASAVYENASATIEQLNEAKAALQKAINDKQFGGATEDNPLDVTEWLVNADFSAGNASGWNVGFISGTNATNVGYQSASYTNGDVTINQFIEAWAANGTAFNENLEFSAIGVGELTQTIENMPAGKYRLTVDCIANQQYESSANPVTGVQLFATGGNIDIYKSLATGNGAPEHFELTFVNDGSDIKMGLRTTEDCTANWIAADNFTLTYYGPTDEDPYKVVLDGTLDEILAAHPLDELDEVVAGAADKEAFKTAIEEAQAATSDYLDHVDKVTAAEKALKNSITAYAAYVKQVAYIREYLAEHDLNAEEAAYLADYLMEDNIEEPGDYFENGSADYIIANGSLSTEEVEAETAKIVALLQTAIANSLNEGDDCTDMITNASFANGFEGWTHSGGNIGDFTGLEPAVPNNVEVYEAAVDCYQVVEGAPDGIYSLSLKGFERPAGNGNYDGTEASKVFLYMNDFQTPVQNIVTGALPTDEAVDGVNCYLSQTYPSSAAGYNLSDYEVSGYGWVPNGMVGAAVAFNAGRYEQKVYGLVDGGQMKIGVTSNGVTAHWVLWADFKLTYEGKSIEALTRVLPLFIESVETYLEENDGNMTTPMIEEAERLVETANTAIKDEDTDAMYTALIALNNIQKDLSENVAAVTAFVAALDEMDEAADNATDNAALDAYAAIQSKTGDYLSLTTEEVIALTEEVKEITAALKVPASDGASDENPVDFTSVIANADIEEGATVAWEYTKDGGNGPALASGLNGTASIEFWNGTAANLKFNIWQTLSKLPAGKYELSADASNSLNGVADTGAEGRAYLYAITSGGTAASTAVAVQEAGCTDAYNNYSVIFTLAEGEDVTIGFQSIGTMAARWFVADNFTLTYYGTGSAKADTEDNGQVDIADIDVNAASVEGVYTISGTQVTSLQKGINIVKYADGKVKKVLVK